MININYVPKSLQECRENYCFPIEEHIRCEAFGEIDDTDDSCKWCAEMTPYMWHMCSDKSWLRNLIKKGYAQHEAIKVIQDYKNYKKMKVEKNINN